MGLFSDENREIIREKLFKYYQADLLRSAFGNLDEVHNHADQAKELLKSQDKDLKTRLFSLTDQQLLDELKKADTHL